MASNEQLDLNYLVYSYLLKKSPKCAKIFSKSINVKVPSSGSPSLEDILKKFLNESGKALVSPTKGAVVNNAHTDSSSDSENEVKMHQQQNIKPSAANKLQASARTNAALPVKSTSTIAKKETSSSSDSDSEGSQCKQKAIRKTIDTLNKKSSTDSSDSEKEDMIKRSKLAGLKVKLISKKESSSSSDSESDSPDMTKIKKPTQTMKIQLQKVEKDSSQSSDDSDSDTEKSKANVTVKKTSSNVKIPSKKESSSSSDSESDSHNTSITAKKLPQVMKIQLQKAKKEISSSSDDSDSDAGNAKSNMNKVLLRETNLISKTPSKIQRNSSSDSESDSPNTLATKKSAPIVGTQQKAEESSSSSSNDSDSDAGKTTSNNKIMPANNCPKTNVSSKMLTKAGSSSSSDSEIDSLNNSVVKKMSAQVMKTQLHKSKEESSSSSADSDPNVGQTKSTTNKVLPNLKSLSTKQTPNMSQNTPVKMDDSSNSSSSSDNEFKPAKKTPSKSNNWMPIINKFAAEFSEDSESDSEKGLMVSLSNNTCIPVNPVSNKMQYPTSNVSISSLKSVSAGKKLNDSSDDSSSDFENEQSKQKRNMKGLNQVGSTTTNRSGKLTFVNSPSKVVVNKGKESDSSDDSTDSDEEEKSKVKSLPIKKSISSIKTIHDVSSSYKSENDVTPSVVQSGKVVATQNKKNITPIKMFEPSIKKTDSSSSSSSSEDEKNIKPALPSNITPISKEMDSSSSDSSSEEEKFNISQKKSINKEIKVTQIRIPSKFAKDESSSDSENYIINKSSPLKAVVCNKVDSNSESEDDTNKNKNPASVSKKPMQESSIKQSEKCRKLSTSSKNEVQLNRNAKINQGKGIQSTLSKPNLNIKPSQKRSSSSGSSSDDKINQGKGIQSTLSKPNLNIKPSQKRSSYSGSSSDEMDKKVKSVAVNQGSTNPNTKSVPIKRKVPKSSSESDSSEDENSTFLSKKSCTLDKKIIKPETKESSSDSSSEENSSNTKAKAVPPKLLGSVSIKKSIEDSSDSSSESDVKKTPNNVLSSKQKTSNIQSFKRKNDSSSDSKDESQPSKKQKVDLQFTPPVNQIEKKTPVTSDSTKRRASSPFRRIKSENVFIDYRLQQSSQIAKHEIPGLGSARGKQFRHEKTKKKKGTHSFGKIDTSVKSLTFD